MLRHVSVLLWRLLAILSLLLGLIGVVVPGLPTVPFLLLAAWAATRSWPALDAWLLNHPRWGESLRLWREQRALSRRAKWAASLTMLASALLIQLMPVSIWVRLGAPAIMACVAVWHWRLPEPRPPAS